MVRFVQIATVAAAACLASGCIKPVVKTAGPTAPAAPADTSAGYQAAIVPGTTTTTAGVLRVNIATGATVIAFGAPTQFTQIPDLSIPAGQYRVAVWSQPQNADNTLAWGAMRTDNISGRVWLLSGSGQTWNWLEITSK